MYVYIHLCMCVYIYAYVCMCAYICAYLYLYKYSRGWYNISYACQLHGLTPRLVHIAWQQCCQALLFIRKTLFFDWNQGYTNVFCHLECDCCPKLGGPQPCGWLPGSKTQEMWSKGKPIFPSTPGIKWHLLSALRNPFFTVAQNKSLRREEMARGRIESV